MQAQIGCFPMSLPVTTFNERFYQTSKKMDQDNFILKHCSSLQPKRVKGESNRKREFTVKYFVTKAVSSSIRIPVCRRTFLGILGIKKHRLFGVISRYHKSGTSAKESRGGDRKAEKFVEKKEKVNS